jgi:hypothetical protein
VNRGDTMFIAGPALTVAGFLAGRRFAGTS